MSDIFRDTTLEQIVRLVTRKRVFQYPEEKPGFQLPEPYAKALQAVKLDHQPVPDHSRQPSSFDDRSDFEDKTSYEGTPAETPCTNDPAMQEKSIGLGHDVETVRYTEAPTILADGTILVGWYGATDPANPQNWTLGKKVSATAIITLYTFAVYMGSSIFTPSYSGAIERFGVSQQVVALTLSMYVLAYGMGPLAWSPLSEIPSIGRGLPYTMTFGIFVILTVPTALVETFPGLVVLRFLLGFFGSPCLATGGASLGDLYPFAKLPYALSLWALAATSGPALGPMISGFSVPVEGWRWSSWEMLWLSGPIWIAMFLLLPETYGPTILLRRAQRLRAFTGNSAFRSQSEIDQARIKVRELVLESLWRPLQTMVFDPSIGFTALYAALIYGIYYSFFECFPLVFGDMYGFNLGEQGLIFLAIGVGALLAAAMYWAYIYWVVEPAMKLGDFGSPERRLIPALAASFLLPVGLFIFAWTASPSIHWIVPTIGITILTIGIFITLQCIFLYLPLGYPLYAASLFAGNDFARSTMAAATIHFSQPLYHNLGVARGVSLLAGLTVGCIAGVFALWYNGAKLRAKSRFARE